MKIVAFVVALVVGGLVYWQATHEPHGHGDHQHDDHHGHAHHHEAPHGGCLVVLGDEFAHLELKIGPDGDVGLWVLDRDAAKGVRIADPALELAFNGTSLTLQPIPSMLTGETVGDTSRFQGKHKDLAGVTEMTLTLKAITIRGQAFDHVVIDYPEGNEASGHAGHDHGAHDH